MNREHWKELLPIITAFANGDDVEEYWMPLEDWQKEQSPTFERDPSRYRIAPKPRKAWLIDYSDGDYRIAVSEKERDEHFVHSGRIAVREIELPPLP